MRVFVGIKITSSIMEKLKEVLSFLQEYRNQIRTVRPENLHITLKFLGNITHNMYSQFSENLQNSITEFSPFEVAIEGIGFFPSKNRARIIWVGIKKNNPLENLYKIVEDSAEKINILPDNKKFHGHITVGRIKTDIHPNLINAIEEKFKERNWENMRVENITIFESILHPDGPKYKELKTMTLGGTENG
ncbi:MAG: 2',5' RNA ligase family [candidate division TA06 bacterium ADurb.Bin131]|uniref:RNA 2',3'-cyclic phosphodiesterase n=1 Tax=candidate division TA06 bacterium ADurb.Bin131 TaxID=1852827 RepID=A0A1V6CDE2_UNCT6|nr:MAG: 2',5' RNA ligase family [candidate division TA06 bacterium ADurb.Bin131]